MGPVVTIGYVLARDYQIQTQINDMKSRTKAIRDLNIESSRSTYSALCDTVSNQKCLTRSEVHIEQNCVVHS